MTSALTTSTASVAACGMGRLRHIAGVVAIRRQQTVLAGRIEVTAGEVNGGSHLPTAGRGKRARRRQALDGHVDQHAVRRLRQVGGSDFLAAASFNAAVAVCAAAGSAGERHRTAAKSRSPMS